MEANVRVMENASVVERRAIRRQTVHRKGIVVTRMGAVGISRDLDHH